MMTGLYVFGDEAGNGADNFLVVAFGIDFNQRELLEEIGVLFFQKAFEILYPTIFQVQKRGSPTFGVTTPPKTRSAP
ncbi:hypothetical protein [Hymenobacter siberiensis]|uniref:hypothetical protein n=1 Tax=Hymenobacter siberiensis TaxID=2848396 RepID=UPI001D019BDA|nr:hypothetical protein [Hymenobacter siberiensis]